MAITARTIKQVFSLVILSVLLVACSTSKQVKKGEETEQASFNKVKFDSYFLEGLKQKTLNNDERARQNFAKALELNPSNDAVLFELAQLAARNRSTENALEYMQKAVQLNPNNIYYLEFTAALYAQTSNYTESAKVYEQLIQLNPSTPEYYFELSSMYLYSNELEKATAAYDSLEATAGFNPDVSEQKVKIYRQLGNTTKAKEEVEKLLEYNPEQVKYYGMLAKLYQQDGETEKAIDIYEQLLQKNPEDPYIHLSLYEFYVETGETSKADSALFYAFKNPSLGIDNKISILINYYKNTEVNRDEMPKVYTLLDQLILAHPKDAKGFAMYGDFLYRDEKLAEARDMYYQSIAIDNSRYLIWNQVLFINSELGDNEAMLKDTEEAMELFPNQPLVYLFNGLTHLQNENYKEAAFALEQGQGLVVDNPAMQNQFFANLGDAYYRLGKYQQAWMNYERALKVNPANDYVLNNYAYYLSIRKESLELAAEMASKVVQRNPTNATYLDTYGWVLFQAEDYRNAKVYLERALENGGSTSGEILEHLGDTYFKLGQVEDAITFWQQASKAGGASDKIEQKITSRAYIE